MLTGKKAKEIISDRLDVGAQSQAVGRVYEKIIAELGNEFHVLLDAPVSDIGKVSDERLEESITRLRQGNVTIAPGYDGVYGTVSVLGK